MRKAVTGYQTVMTYIHMAPRGQARQKLRLLDRVNKLQFLRGHEHW